MPCLIKCCPQPNKRCKNDVQRRTVSRLTGSSELKDARLKKQHAYLESENSTERTTRLKRQANRQTAYIESQSATERVARLQGQLERQTSKQSSQSSFECSTRLKLEYEVLRMRKRLMKDALPV